MRIFLLLLSVSLLTSCASVTARKDPTVKLGQFTHFYVEQRLNDNNSTGLEIAADLTARGYTASCGPLTMMPNETQVLITYDARWTWDFRSYLIDLNIVALQPHSRKTFAAGNYHQTGIVPKEPEKLIHTLLDKFFQ